VIPVSDGGIFGAGGGVVGGVTGVVVCGSIVFTPLHFKIKY
jgi:hypothetical protein